MRKRNTESAERERYKDRESAMDAAQREEERPGLGYKMHWTKGRKGGRWRGTLNLLVL